MAKIQLSSPHSHNRSQTNQVMLKVIYACVPAFIALTYFFGPGVLVNLSLSALTALAAEALVLHLRKRNFQTLRDNSALVTAVLLAACLPANAPWWIPILGAAFAILGAKQLYGGLGQNPFNPAMATYAFLLISFPVEMTQWQLSFTAGQGGWFNSLQTDSLTGATALDAWRNKGLVMASEFWQAVDAQTNQLHLNTLTSTGIIALAWLIGGAYLIQQRLINWQVPTVFFLTLLIGSTFIWGLNTSHYAPPWLHFVAGSAVFAGFFILTDPVTCATSVKGRIVFALGAAILVLAIRTWGNYPDGLAFAVLLMNFAAPSIDYFTRPRVYGQGK